MEQWYTLVPGYGVIAIPHDRIGVTPDEFAVMLKRAVRPRDAHPEHRYTAAVFVTLMWVAGVRDQDPLTAEHRPVTRDSQRAVHISAGAIYLDIIDPVLGLTGEVHQDWALEVDTTLGWVRGLDETTGRRQGRPPLTTPKRGKEG
jgi:hypothetical protein